MYPLLAVLVGAVVILGFLLWMFREASRRL
jgi:nitrate reductase NapE component